jgi:RNA polymerase sigma-70 factor (ECF subfamily)
MSEHAAGTTTLLLWVRLGEEARNRLIGHARKRLQNLASRMLRRAPAVERWEATDDVLQKSLIRLDRALRALIPESSGHFWKLAALQIRRELRDLIRHYSGPLGLNSHRPPDSAVKVLERHPSWSGEPSTVAEWKEFLKYIDALPKAEREVVDLLHVQELTQEAVAAQLGVSVRTVRRLWQSARLKLAAWLTGEQPR